MEKQKWIPLLRYCFPCQKAYFIPHQHKVFKKKHDINQDNRFLNKYHDKKITRKVIWNLTPDKLKNLQQKLTKEEFEGYISSEIPDFCNSKLVKLYAILRIDGKQKWRPVFWYCPCCYQMVSKISDDNEISPPENNDTLNNNSNKNIISKSMEKKKHDKN